MSVETGTAILIAGGLAAGGTVASSAINSSASADATKAAAAGQEKAIDSQTGLAKTGVDYLTGGAKAAQDALAPALAANKAGLEKLTSFIDPNNPLYGMEENQGTRAIQRTLAAQGLLRSRSQGDSLANLQLGLTQQRLGVASGLAGSGADRASAAVSTGTGSNIAALIGGFAPNIASSLSGLGNIIAGGELARGGAAAGGVSGVGGAVQGTLGNWMTYNQQQSQLALLQQLLARGGGTTSGMGTLPALGPAEIPELYG